MKYEIVIGCEIHVQLNTKAKAFCACKNLFGGKPNTRVCAVCMGLPGALPVPNRTMIENAILAGLALNCKIASLTKFDRKNYIYPDLPKAYQISQFDMPICTNGHLEIATGDGNTRKIRIIRVHMEEDTGKNIHAADGSGNSYVDYNRSGTPLMEIVSEPDIRSPGEAVSYVQGIREIMSFLDISDCNMEEGSLRCDANINLWIYENEQKFATPIVEVKNMNSFRSIKNALSYEVERQLAEWVEKRLVLKKGSKTTRGYDDTRGITVLQRTKEEAAEYRYFPEPDIKPISVPPQLISRLKQRVGELPAAKRRRFLKEYNLEAEEVTTLTASKAFACYFEEVCKHYKNPKKAANWLLGDVKSVLNEQGIEIEEFKIKASQLAELLSFIDSGQISGKIAKGVFAEMVKNGQDAAAIIKNKGLQQITDVGEVEKIVLAVLEQNPGPRQEYCQGNEKALKFLMGQVMKISKGKANPQLAQKLLIEKMGG